MKEVFQPTQVDQFQAIQADVDAAFTRHVTKIGRSTVSLDSYSLVPIADYPALRSDYEDHVQQWAEKGIDIKPLVRATLLIDTATEENLPSYTAHIEKGFELWHEWNLRWTAEERSHGEIMLRDIEARGILDMSREWLPVRDHNMATGIHPTLLSPADGISYVATQELLTKVAHFQSARFMDERGVKTLRAVGADEGRHYRFYVSTLEALTKVFPDAALAGMRRQHEGDAFAMPGRKGILDYDNLAKIIALSGIFDSLTVLDAQKQTIDEAGLLSAEPVTDQGKRDQEWAYGISSKEDKAWKRKERLMMLLRERAARDIIAGELRPVILGQTVELNGNTYSPIHE